MNPRSLLGALLLLACGSPVYAQQLTLATKHPWGGSLLRMRVDLGANRTDSVVDVQGTLAGEPLHFSRTGRSASTFGAIPTGASDSLIARVLLVRASGHIDSLRQKLRFPHQAAPAGGARVRRGRGPRRARRLRVDRRFTVPQDSTASARIEQENELARHIGIAAHAVPQLWTEPFLAPRHARVTSRFGSGRVFNGRVASSHLGTDFAGHTGDPVFAANRGVVALVDSFYLAGNVVYIDHGAGVTTGYFHLSQAMVQVGDTVGRGQEIGLVGATGRVTGPHLHWAARYGAISFDPEEILRVTRAQPRIAPPTPSLGRR